MQAEEDEWITLFVPSFTVKVPLYKVVNLHWHCGAYGRSGIPPTCVYRDIQINSSEIQPSKIDWAGVHSAHRQWPKLQKSNTWFLKVKKQSTLQSASTSLTKHALKLKVDRNHTEDRCSDGLLKHFKKSKPIPWWCYIIKKGNLRPHIHMHTYIWENKSFVDICEFCVDAKQCC